MRVLEKLAYVRPPDEFCRTCDEFCTTPGAKCRQFRSTAIYEPATAKRLARSRWSETHRISLHEKKKKILLVQNSS
jgi:hypothetical protein